MRAAALFVIISAALFGTSSAVLVDAGEKTTVDVSYCSAYDTANCGSSGCNCDKTRDFMRAAESRWSCKYDLARKPCRICYTFDEPQDIVRMKVSFWKGNTRTRSFRVELTNRGVDDQTFEFTSSLTNNYENYFLYSDETEELCVESIDLPNSDWFSPNELKFMVEA